MRKRNLIGAAAFSLALAGGGVAGAVLGTPSVSGAQDDTTTTTEQVTDSDTARPKMVRAGARFEMTAAADALGMTPAELLAEIKDGKSIAEVAEAKGVDLSDVTDAMVAAGTERLQERIDSLPERVAEGVQRKGLPERPEGGRRGMGGHERPADAPDDAPAEDAPVDDAS